MGAHLTVILEDLGWNDASSSKCSLDSCVACAVGGESAVFVQLVVDRCLPGSAASLRASAAITCFYMSALSSDVITDTQPPECCTIVIPCGRRWSASICLELACHGFCGLSLALIGFGLAKRHHTLVLGLTEHCIALSDNACSSLTVFCLLLG